MKRAKIAAIVLGIVGAVGGAYVFGTYTVENKLSPYPSVLEQAFSAVDVYIGELEGSRTAPIETEGESGVTLNRDGTFDGYTFYTPDTFPGARLLDMSGEVVHEWRKPFEQVWQDPPHVGSGEPRSGAIWRSATLLPNGDVLAVFAMIGATPYGYGLVKVDRQSNVVWRFAEHVNHLVKVDDEGNVYALTHEFRNVDKDPVSGNPQLGAQETSKILEDHIAILGPDGEQKQTFSLLDGIAKSPLSPLLETFPTPDDRNIYNEANWDPMHPNNIEVVTPELADHAKELEVGQVLVSFRTLDALIAFDRETERAVWATRGFWRRQHDPDILEDGDIMVFDNRGNAGPGGVSRIVRYTPSTGALETIYRGSKDHPFQTVTSGSQHPLPNGNVLVTESNRGRLFEVTSEGELVWEYIAGGGGRRPHVHSAMRVSDEWLEFEP